MVFIGKVISLEDEYDAGRIKVRLKNADVSFSDDNLPYAWPLLPKMLHVVPKVNEAVLVFCVNDDPKQQRFYLGPIISQYQKMYKDYHDTSALKMIGGRGGSPFPAVSNIPKTFGAFGTDEDIIIYGRKYSDIIMGDNDVRIRCGAHLTGISDTTDIGFNKTNPSLIKLKYHESPINVDKLKWNDSAGEFSDKENRDVESSVNIIGQEINLISTEGEPYVDTSHTDKYPDGNESLSDDDLKKFIEMAHPLPYGDVLVRFLYLFLKAFKTHTHKYSQLPPVPDTNYIAATSFPLDSILSKNVRLN